MASPRKEFGAAHYVFPLQRNPDHCEYSQVGMSENVTPSEGTLETCLFDCIINDFALLKVIFLGRRGAGDLLRLSTVTNLTVVVIQGLVLLSMLFWTRFDCKKSKVSPARNCYGMPDWPWTQ